MRVRIVCYEDIDKWILGKFASKLNDELRKLSIDSDISKVPDKKADINHHIIYYDYDGSKNSIDTVMITHIDAIYKVNRLKKQLINAEMGICMSSSTMNILKNLGLPAHKLCYILPAHDGNLIPRSLVVGIFTKIFNDGRKREGLLRQLAKKINPSEFSFKIMGEGWGLIVQELMLRGFAIEYFPLFDYQIYHNLIPSLDYYLYLGNDEGSMAFIDALAAGIPTIVTPQGYHLDALDGISYPFETFDDLACIFEKIAESRRKLIRSVAGWTWRNYAVQHLQLWNYLLAGRNSELIQRTIVNYQLPLGNAQTFDNFQAMRLMLQGSFRSFSSRVGNFINGLLKKH